MAITKSELEADEEEAINKYDEYLKQEPHSKKEIFMIKKIRDQEKQHLAELKKL